MPRSACRYCHARPATLGLVHPDFDYMIPLCTECYEQETNDHR